MDTRQFHFVPEQQQEQVIAASRSVWVCVWKQSHRKPISSSPLTWLLIAWPADKAVNQLGPSACKHERVCVCVCVLERKMPSHTVRFEVMLFPAAVWVGTFLFVL